MREKWKTTLMERKNSYINKHEMRWAKVCGENFDDERSWAKRNFVGIFLDLIYMFWFCLWKVFLLLKIFSLPTICCVCMNVNWISFLDRRRTVELSRWKAERSSFVTPSRYHLYLTFVLQHKKKKENSSSIKFLPPSFCSYRKKFFALQLCSTYSSFCALFHAK